MPASAAARASARSAATTAPGFLDLAVVLDAFSRRIVGGSMAAHLRTALVLDVLLMALERCRLECVIHHSDRGSQYTAITFGARCRQAGVRPSMGSVGDCYDNALRESFFATLECELIDRTRLRSCAEALMAVFELIEGWYPPAGDTPPSATCHPSTTKGVLAPRSPKPVTVHENGTTPLDRKVGSLRTSQTGTAGDVEVRAAG